MFMIYFALSRMCFFFFFGPGLQISDLQSRNPVIASSLLVQKWLGIRSYFKKNDLASKKKIQQIRLLGALGKERFGILLNLVFLVNTVL